MANNPEPPSGSELAGILASSKSAVLTHARRKRRTLASIRILGIAAAGAVLFGGGVSLGSAVASPIQVSARSTGSVVKVACVESPGSSSPFAYLSVATVAEGHSAAPAVDCGNVWKESVELSSQRAAALALEQEYEKGYCAHAGASSCLPRPVATAPIPAVEPAQWADCSARDGYYFEVGYSTGTAAAACKAQGLTRR